MPDSTVPVTTEASSSTEVNLVANDQLSEELKKPRRVLKTHRKSIDESKDSSSKLLSSLDEEEFSITTDSLKEMLSVPQRTEIVKLQSDMCENRSIQE
ncbi:3701_t:CDS:2, partial [Acaulospora colombiana]